MGETDIKERCQARAEIPSQFIAHCNDIDCEFPNNSSAVRMVDQELLALIFQRNPYILGI